DLEHAVEFLQRGVGALQDHLQVAAAPRQARAELVENDREALALRQPVDVVEQIGIDGAVRVVHGQQPLARAFVTGRDLRHRRPWRLRRRSAARLASALGLHPQAPPQRSTPGGWPAHLRDHPSRLCCDGAYANVGASSPLTARGASWGTALCTWLPPFFRGGRIRRTRWSRRSARSSSPAGRPCTSWADSRTR